MSDFYCELCKIDLKFKKEITPHLLSKFHLRKLRKFRKNQTKKHYPYYCCYCNFRFKKKSKIRAHIQKYHYDKVYVCLLCGRREICDRKFTDHLRYHKRIYKCGSCNSSYTSQVRLDKHLRACAAHQKVLAAEHGHSEHAEEKKIQDPVDFVDLTRDSSEEPIEDVFKELLVGLPTPPDSEASVPENQRDSSECHSSVNFEAECPQGQPPLTDDSFTGMIIEESFDYREKSPDHQFESFICTNMNKSKYFYDWYDDSRDLPKMN